MENNSEERSLKQLRANFEMYENSKKETLKKMKNETNPDGTKKYTQEKIDDTMKLLQTAQDEVVAEYVLFGGKEEDLRTPKKATKKSVTKDGGKNMSEIINEMKTTKSKDEVRIDDIKKEVKDKFEKDYRTFPSENGYSKETYDVIPLPSMGECYKDKFNTLPVSYINAWDENIIVAPNLYKNNTMLDYVLREKIMNKDINPMDLLEGDRDAIILFLRANAYGNEYPITAVDDVTGEEFDAIINLADLHYKPFTLKGDSNGWFPFTLPVAKNEIKFKFLTHGDMLALKEYETLENLSLRKDSIADMVRSLDAYVEVEDKVDNATKVRIRQAIRTLEEWGDGMDEETAQQYTHALTNRMEAMIMSVDGITEPEYVKKFVRSMKPRDCAELRKYINTNEPGVDYNITIKKPERLGGGEMKTFLQFDQFIFLNVA